MKREIKWLRSLKTEKKFPIIETSADTDMDNDWLFPLTSNENLEIVLAKISPDEVLASTSHHKQINEGLLMFQNRINREMGRTDLRVTWSVRVQERMEKSVLGNLFCGFLNTYVSPKIYYQDIFCDSGEAEVLMNESIEEFEDKYGKIIYY